MANSTTVTGVTRKQRAILLGAALVGAVLVVCLVVLWPRSSCEGIFEQTAPRLEANLEIIRNKGALSVGQEKIQELAESAQKVGLHLKTCCAVLSGGKLNPAQFQQCIASASSYEQQVAKVAQQVDAAEKIPAASAPEAAQLRETIASTISAATRGADSLALQVTQLRPAVPAPATQREDAPAGSESEPNNNPASANPLAAGEHVEGEIQQAGDNDYYAVSAPKRVRDYLEVSLENLSETLQPQLTVYDQNKSRQGSEHYDTTPGANLRFAYVAEVGATNFVQVSGLGNSIGSYRLQLSYQDAADANEPNDSATQATGISQGNSVSGSVLDGHDSDWYRFTANSAALRLRMDNESDTLSPQMVIYDGNRSRLANPYNGTNGASLDFDLDATPGSLYYVQIVPYGDTSVPGKYRLSLNARE